MRDETIQVQPIKALIDNYIWCITKGSSCVIVDPGSSSAVTEFLSTTNLKLKAILITHHHSDHIGGIDDLRSQEIDIYCSKGCQDYLQFKAKVVEDGETLDILGHSVEVLSTPGHTLDHICYFFEKDKLLFAGDALFIAGCGRIFEGNNQMTFSTINKFKELPKETKFYSGHEYSITNLNFAKSLDPDNQKIFAKLTSVKALLANGKTSYPGLISEEFHHNPFFRTKETQIYNNINIKDKDELSVFRELRHLRNNY